MSNTITIPADALADVRDGLALEIGQAIDGLEQLLDQRDREQQADRFETNRHRLEAAFALVDRVGWAPGESKDEITIDLAEQGDLLKHVIEAQLPALRALLEEIDLSDAWRASEGMPPRKQELQARERTVERFAGQLGRALEGLGV